MGLRDLRLIILLIFAALVAGCGLAGPVATDQAASGTGPGAPRPSGAASGPSSVYFPFGARLHVPRIQRVLIITVDGLRPDAIAREGKSTGLAPALFELAGSGAVDWSARTVIPTATLAGHTSLLSGYGVEQHGVDTFVYRTLRERYDRIPVPTIFDLARQRGFRTTMILGKSKMDFLVPPGGVDRLHIDRDDRSDHQIADTAISFVRAGFDLMLVHFPDVDESGHEFGWMSPEYLAAVRRMDRHVGRVLNALEQEGLAPTTLLILTADHGGHEKGHTTGTIEDQQIPWMIAGPGVPAGRSLADRQIQIMDTAPTALWALGIEPPENLDGRTVLEAFDLTPDPRFYTSAQR